MDAQGVLQPDIARTLGVSMRTIQWAKNKLENTGCIEGGGKKRGRKPTMVAGMELVSV